jgi:hypothetical protein
VEVAIVISPECFKTLLRLVPKESIAHASLRNGVVFYGVVKCPCTMEQAEQLLEIAKNLRPEAVPDIQQAIDFARPTRR